MKVYQRKLEKPKPGDSNKKYTFELVKENKNSVRKNYTRTKIWPKWGDTPDTPFNVLKST